MVAVTYGSARGATAGRLKAKSANKSVAKGPSFWARLFDAVTRSQMIRAEREIARHRHLLPPNFKLTRRTDEPFGGW